MATYEELRILFDNSSLQNRTATAVAVKAQALLSLATPSPNQLAWADKALRNPKAEGIVLLKFILAANKAATVAQIEGASDEDIQGNVDSAADALIAGGVV